MRGDKLSDVIQYIQPFLVTPDFRRVLEKTKHCEIAFGRRALRGGIESPWLAERLAAVRADGLHAERLQADLLTTATAGPSLPLGHPDDLFDDISCDQAQRDAHSGIPPW